MYKAVDVARYIIDICNKENKVVTNLKLQKFLYFVQAQFLVQYNSPCFKEEIEAWEYGPVVPEVYRKYKVYGGSHIPTFLHKKSRYYGIDEEDGQLINGIVEQCSKYSASSLIEITQHQTPWIEAYITGNKAISLKSVKKFFS